MVKRKSLSVKTLAIVMAGVFFLTQVGLAVVLAAIDSGPSGGVKNHGAISNCCESHAQDRDHDETQCACHLSTPMGHRPQLGIVLNPCPLENDADAIVLIKSSVFHPLLQATTLRSSPGEFMENAGPRNLHLDFVRPPVFRPPAA